VFTLYLEENPNLRRCKGTKKNLNNQAFLNSPQLVTTTLYTLSNHTSAQLSISSSNLAWKYTGSHFFGLHFVRLSCHLKLKWVCMLFFCYSVFCCGSYSLGVECPPKGMCYQLGPPSNLEVVKPLRGRVCGTTLSHWGWTLKGIMGP
jgi:hypothetical protein